MLADCNLHQAAKRGIIFVSVVLCCHFYIDCHTLQPTDLVFPVAALNLKIFFVTVVC
jgi:hypothetical protein